MLPDPSSFGTSPLQHLSDVSRGESSQQLMSPKSVIHTTTNSLLEQRYRSAQQSAAHAPYYQQTVGRLAGQKGVEVFSQRQVIPDEQRHSPQKHSSVFSAVGFNTPVFGSPAFNLDQQLKMRLVSGGVTQGQTSLTHMEPFNNTQPLTHKREVQPQPLPRPEKKFDELLR